VFVPGSHCRPEFFWGYCGEHPQGTRRYCEGHPQGTRRYCEGHPQGTRRHCDGHPQGTRRYCCQRIFPKPRVSVVSDLGPGSLGLGPWRLPAGSRPWALGPQGASRGLGDRATQFWIRGPRNSPGPKKGPRGVLGPRGSRGGRGRAWEGPGRARERPRIRGLGLKSGS